MPLLPPSLRKPTISKYSIQELYIVKAIQDLANPCNLILKGYKVLSVFLLISYPTQVLLARDSSKIASHNMSPDVEFMSSVNKHAYFFLLLVK